MSVRSPPYARNRDDAIRGILTDAPDGPAKGRLSPSRERRANLLRALSDRDGGDVCFYCGVPLVLLDRRAELCEWVPRSLDFDHCGCGWHDVANGEPCPVGGYWLLPDDRRRAEIDHVLPRSRGGSDDLANLVLACSPCNSAKGTKTPDEWRPIEV